MKHATKILAALLLALAMVVGLMPGMGMAAKADSSQKYKLTFSGLNGSLTREVTTWPYEISQGDLIAGCYDDYYYYFGSAWNFSQASSSDTDCVALEGNKVIIKKAFEGTKSVNPINYVMGGNVVRTDSMSITCAPLVPVTGISLDKTETTLTAGGDPVALTATVAPDDATDKTVKWSIIQGDQDIALYSDEGCTTPLSLGVATDTLTVYVKALEGANGGTVQVESNADSTKAATCTVTVKAAQTITAEDVTATYGDTGKKIEATTSGDGALSYAVKSGDAVTVDPSSGALTIVKVGTATITVTAAETATHAQATKDVTVTVTKAGASRDVPEKALPFTGQPQELVTAGTVNGGTLQYALGTDANTAPADGWSTDVPTATEPGTYYVWYRVIGDENHNNVEPACVVVTITPAAVATPTANSDSDYTLLASMKTSGNKAFKLKWTAVTGAEGYDVFFGDCGGGECTLERTVTGTSCKIGKLKKGNAYKAFVKVWRTENGQKVYIGEASPDVHAVAGGKSNKYTNPKKITVKKKKLTVNVGASKKIKASLKKFSNSRRYLNHTAKIRYFSSNRAVATVDAKGKVTGVAPGTCTVFAVAENGLRKGVKITVK